jgi:UDP-N-acetylmuramate dehydrogenase
VPASLGVPGNERLTEVLDFAERELSARLGERVECNVGLSGFTTFRLGGPARIFLRAQSVDDLDVLAQVLADSLVEHSCAIPVVVVGQGSNLLVGDGGFLGVAVHLGGDFAEISIEPSFPIVAASSATATDSHLAAHSECTVRAGGAVKLPVLARKCAAAGCLGLGWMVGVPGSVGGAVRMNAGGHGSDISANVVSVEIVDLLAPAGQRIRTVTASDLALQYRSSSVTASQIVVSATFACTSGHPAILEAELTEIVRWRRANQPGGANCGSVFTNPVNQSAGKLIDDLGLRGFRLHPSATASVSDKHANFIQADPDGLARDVWELIVHVRSAVFERYGIVLHPEVQTLGFNPELPALLTPSPTDERGM